MEVNSFQLSAIVTNISILDIGKGPALAKLIFVWQKKPFNSIQKLFMTETDLYGYCKITFTIAASSLLLSFKIQLFATVVEGFYL